MKTAFLALNPIEHIMEDAPLKFEEVIVHKIDMKIKRAYILCEDKRHTIPDWGDFKLRAVGFIWLFTDWATGVVEIEAMKAKKVERYG
jgi:hypothetical protein